MDRRSVAALAVCVFALAACGSRVVPLSQDQYGGSAGGPIGGSAGTTAGGAGTGTTTTTSGGVTGLTTGGSAGFATTGGPTGLVPGCTATKGTDRGVTKDTIKLGLVASLTGPLPGQFDASVEATDAYFRAVNDAGGICGRKVQLLVRDDSGNAELDRKVAEALAIEDKVFAFVGSVSAPHDEGIGQISEEHRIPDIGFPLTWSRTESRYTYGIPGQLTKEWIGEGASGTRYLNKVNGIKRAALFWLNESEVSIMNAWAFETAMMKSSGGTIEICHEQEAGVLDNNFLNYVVAMEGACGDPSEVAVYTTMENNANVKLALAMADQGYKPKVFAPTFTSYMPAFTQQGGAAVEGAYIAMPQIPFERISTPQSTWTQGTVEMSNYLTTLKRYFPRHKAPGSFGGAGWGMAALFTEVAKSCGEALTRTCALKRLDTMGAFSVNGFLTPTRPGAHRIYTTDLIVQVRNGRFVEIRPNDKSGPKDAPDFWNTSPLFNWQIWMCANDTKFPNMQAKRRLLDRC